LDLPYNPALAEENEEWKDSLRVVHKKDFSPSLNELCGLCVSSEYASGREKYLFDII